MAKKTRDPNRILGRKNNELKRVEVNGSSWSLLIKYRIGIKLIY